MICELYTLQAELSTSFDPIELSLMDHASTLLLVQKRDHTFQLCLFTAQLVGQLPDFPVQLHVFSLK